MSTTSLDSHLVAVVTTIRPPTPALADLGRALARVDASLVVAGDIGGPPSFELPGTVFLSFAAQAALPLALVEHLPARTYARKNVAYLEAMRRRASLIYETDDDNAPASTWGVRQETTSARPLPEGEQWLNAYRYFGVDEIWPRGFPLARVRHPGPLPRPAPATSLRAPVQQGLVDGSPDVDAVWRLVMDRPIRFTPAESICLPAGTWCPFNSQSTWWWPDAFPLMYLPSTCSFRLTDIWRSFVAQRCLWALGCGLVFHAAEMVQERNPHDLMRDFNDEVAGYLRNEELVTLLAALELDPGPTAVAANLRRCYQSLVAAGFFAAEELTLVDAWRADLETVRRP